MKNKKLIINASVFDGETILSDKAIVIENDKVTKVVNLPYTDNECDTIDASGLIIAPAFIDLQVNGGGGKLFAEEPNIQTLYTMSATYEKFGTMYILPTVISSDLNTMLLAIEATKQAQSLDLGILGVHLEGPYLHEKKSGIHDKKHIRLANIPELEKLYDNSDNLIKIMTVAPEAFDKSCMEYAIEHGTKIFVGHSNADFDTAYTYLTSGAVGVTHLFNAMSQLGSREPGVVGASYLTDTWAGIIADGIHVDLRNVRISKQIKKNKLFLITDAMPPVGIGDCDFRIGSTEIHCINGKCLSNDGTIAGSALNMNKALQNAVFECDIPLVEALKMTSTYQSEILEIPELGHIRKGSNADLVFLDKQLNVVGYIKRGKLYK